MRPSVLLVCALAVAPLAAKQPITHETLWSFKRLSSPAVSPDGKQIVFSVTEAAYDAKDTVSDLWIVPSDGSAPPRRITSGHSGENSAAWSPDGGRLAFVTKREGDETPQIYLLDLKRGGEAIRLTSVSTGASSPRWSPDAGRLLFTSFVYPGAADDEANQKIAAERKSRKYNARRYDGFPIRYWDHWLDDRRPSLLIQEAVPGSKARDLLAGTQLAAAPGFYGSPTLSSAELRAEWSPDGSAIVFVATTNRNEAAYADVRYDLYRTRPEGGEPVRLTSGPDSYSHPKFSPDGGGLYCIHEAASRYNYNLPRLARFSWRSTGPLDKPAILTAGFDRQVDSYVMSEDGRTIYIESGDAGHDRVYSMRADGGTVQPLTSSEVGSYSELTLAGGTLASIWQSATAPPEIVRFDQDRRNHAAITSFNAAKAAEVDWQPVREFWFNSKRGKRIHSMIALPPAFDESKKYPLLVLMHGGPHSMWKDELVIRWNYHLLAAPGYVVLMTNYTGSTGFGEDFAREIEGDPLKGPAEEINQAADEAIKRYPFIDASRQAAAGASYGGHLANWMQASTARYKCLISHAGLINLESQWGTSDGIYHRERVNGGPPWEGGRIWREQNPIRHAKQFRTPILLTVGEHDFRVPLNETLENWSVLQRLRIPSRLIVFPEANHWVMRGEDSRYYYQEVQTWLSEHLR